MSDSLPSSPAMTRSLRGVSTSSATGGGLPSPSMSRSLNRSISASSSAAIPLPRQSSRSSSAPTNMAKSMTIEEMRVLHQKALSDAEAKRTELRLVLASRYRELVGSSDEVLRMRERSEELHQLVHAIPTLMTKLVNSSKTIYQRQESKEQDTTTDSSTNSLNNVLRRDLSRLPRIVHRSLDKQDVHTATIALIQLFKTVAQHTNKYPLANALCGINIEKDLPLDPMLVAQMKMTFLHVQTIPARTQRIAKKVLLQAAQQDKDALLGAHRSASALSTLDLLQVTRPIDRAVPLLDLYFDSKAKLLQSLLSQLSSTETNNSVETIETDNADVILSQMVGILQHDIILHPYQIFCLRKFPGNSVDKIMETMPMFDADVVKSKASHFLAAHLPLIRTKVKSVLVSIAGTTASALGHIRQSLYDKTDGVDCMELLDSNGVCSWEDAVNNMVDVRVVLSQGGPVEKNTSRKFSLWSALFSNTFSSLVHSLLTSSFHSVHSKVVSTLRTSLANAPPFSKMLPHEAYRNTLKIATDLDAALLKVSDDAHELLVHAEERAESERRLRQSLYVQTCEIMGRLVCELRRMLLHKTGLDDATKEFVVGRLCHLLKFRLTSLATLLNPQHSPAVLGGGGMITLLELQSAFDLADDDDDGLITFEEAMEAVDSAFSGTQFHGAEMIRETMLLTTKPEDGRGAQPVSVPSNVTCEELALLSARGLKHDKSGANSALGTIQRSLNDIIDGCFTQWAKVALTSANESLKDEVSDFFTTAASLSEAEWQRIFDPNPKPALPEFGEYMEQADDSPEVGAPLVGNVSPHVTGYILALSSLLNRSICPSDSMNPTPSEEYASTLGLTTEDLPSMMATIRLFLLKQALQYVSTTLDEQLESALQQDGEKKSVADGCPSAIIQMKIDFSFLEKVFFERNKHGFEWRKDREDDNNDMKKYKSSLEKTLRTTEQLLQSVWSNTAGLPIAEKHAHVFEVSDLFYSSLLGEDSSSDFVGTGISAPLLYNPLTSSRRFGLLPIQSDRSLAELQRRGKFGKDKDDEQKQESSSGVIGSGLGFFSSMLKKK